MCGSFETGSKSTVAPSEAPVKAGVPLALGPHQCLEAQCRPVQLLAFSGGCWLAHWHGLALQDTELGAGGREI